MGRDKLTAKQKAFIKEYLVDLNATQACLRAGYCKKNPSNADVQGAQLTSNPEIMIAIQKAMDERAERVQVTSDDVLRELLSIATVDPLDAFKKNGELRSPHRMLKAVRKSIAGISGGSIRFWDKTKALDLLGRHLKLWDKNQNPIIINNLSTLSDAELDEKIKELRRKATKPDES